MKIFLNKFSRLGVIFIGIHTTLVLLIPLWARIFPSSSSCGIFPCIFSDELAYFLLFNIPGLFAGYIILPILQAFKSNEARLSGDFTMIDYIPIYVSSAVFYYFAGALIQLIFSGSNYRLRIKKVVRKNS